MFDNLSVLVKVGILVVVVSLNPFLGIIFAFKTLFFSEVIVEINVGVVVVAKYNLAISSLGLTVN